MFLSQMVLSKSVCISFWLGLCIGHPKAFAKLDGRPLSHRKIRLDADGCTKNKVYDGETGGIPCKKFRIIIWAYTTRCAWRKYTTVECVVALPRILNQNIKTMFRIFFYKVDNSDM